MPTTPEHRAKAENNEFLVDTLENPFWDWAINGVFYAALHYVEAYFASRVPAVHPSTHTIRDNHIHRDKTLKPIYVDYRQLEDESRNARYDAGMKFTQSDVGMARGCLDRIKKVILPLL
ncbi:MAG: hypothetical protein ABSF45_00575 [Terriglobia bacterium]